MPRTTSTLPDDIHSLIEGSIDAGVFENKSDAVRHALREYFDDNEDVRVAAAARLYADGEISLGKASQLAGVSRFEMPEVLRQHGVEVELGPEDMDEARDEIDTARSLSE